MKSKPKYYIPVTHNEDFVRSICNSTYVWVGTNSVSFEEL